MNWMDEVRARLKRNNQILFAKDGVLLQDLAALIQTQTRRTMVLWALELAEEAARTLAGRCPDECRPEKAALTARAWAEGKVKMPVAQRAILQAHAAAKELDSPEDIALCHAIGQACGVVHTPGHAMGFPVYELTAMVHRHGIDACKAPVEARRRQYLERVEYWRDNRDAHPCEWAGFLAE